MGEGMVTEEGSGVLEVSESVEDGTSSEAVDESEGAGKDLLGDGVRVSMSDDVADGVGVYEDVLTSEELGDGMGELETPGVLLDAGLLGVLEGPLGVVDGRIQLLDVCFDEWLLSLAGILLLDPVGASTLDPGELVSDGVSVFVTVTLVVEPPIGVPEVRVGG